MSILNPWHISSQARCVAMTMLMIFLLSSFQSLYASVAPTASRYSPSGSSVTVTEGDSQTFTVQGNDANGDLRGVEWYLDGSHVGSTFDLSGSSDTSGRSFQFNSPGTKSVEALVFDQAGNYSSAAAWSVTIQPASVAPTASRYSPSSSSVTVTEGDSQTFTVQGNDANGDLRGVEWYLDGSHVGSTFDLSGSSDTSGRSFQFNSPGTKSVEALVFDQAGNYSSAAAWSVTIQPAVPPARGLYVDHFESILFSEIQTASLLQFIEDNEITSLTLYSTHQILPNSGQAINEFIDRAKNQHGVTEVLGAIGSIADAQLIVDYNESFNSDYDGVCTEFEFWHKPTASRYSPSGSSVTVTEGDSQTFTVQGKDATEDLRGVEWYLDGSHVGSTFDLSGSSDRSSRSFQFNSPGTKSVQALVFDEAGNYSSSAATWSVTIQAADPPARGLYVDLFESIPFSETQTASLLEFIEDTEAASLTPYSTHQILPNSRQPIDRLFDREDNQHEATESFTFDDYMNLLIGTRQIIGDQIVLVTYLGWLLDGQAQQIAPVVDRIYLHAYVTDPSSAFNYSKNRLAMFSQFGSEISLYPIFSAEPDFMGPWLENNSLQLAESTFSDDWAGDTPQNLSLDGFQWFAYSHINQSWDIAAPTASRYSPSSSSVTVTEGDSQTFTVQGNDANGDLRGVEWYLDGSHVGSTFDLSGSSDTSGRSFQFNSPGTKSVEALVFDQAGNYSSAAAWSVNIAPMGPKRMTTIRIRSADVGVPGKIIYQWINGSLIDSRETQADGSISPALEAAPTDDQILEISSQPQASG